MSVGRDRGLEGGAIVRLRDERGAMLALRLRPGQVRTLAKGLGGSPSEEAFPMAGELGPR